MTASCRQCNSTFDITDEDRGFLEKVSPVFGERHYIPDPVYCPDCRLQRRLLFRDERCLYHRKSDLSGQEMITIYSPDKPFKVFTSEEWYGDQWDTLEYGREFDFNQPFFKQFRELQLAVPRLQYSVYTNENCPYVNRTCNSKNCYLVFNSDRNEDCYYMQSTHGSKNSIDCSFSYKMEWSAHCTDCTNCYKGIFLEQCVNVSESAFCLDCRDCHDLILCTNLRGKSYCIANKQYSKEEYFEEKKRMQINSNKGWDALKKKFINEVRPSAIRLYAKMINCTNSVGENISNCKNCYHCFDINKGEDLKYVMSVENFGRDAMDCTNYWENAELGYQCMSCSSYHCLFCTNVWESSELLYCDLCKNAKKSFGSVGLKRHEYCIFNKQYSKNEYDVMVEKIIVHMKKTGEWGRFFPPELSPYCYNETVAQDYFPMTKTEALSQGFQWYDAEQKTIKIQDAYAVPENINDVNDDIVGAVLASEKSAMPFKIIKQELDLYRTLQIPVPRLECEERFQERFALRSPKKFWNRVCSGCNKPLESVFSPDRLERVYCEECYLAEVY